MKKIIVSILGLLPMIATGAWAQEPVDIEVATTANGWSIMMPEGRVELEAEYYPNLLEASDNSEWIKANNGQTADVWLGCQLQEDKWNTFVVPFNISSEEMAAKGIVAKEMTSSTFDSDKGVLTLTFSNASAITGGKPYMVKAGTEMEGFIFDGVTISAAEPTDVTTGDNSVTFKGIFAPKAIGEGGDNTLLYLGEGNTLFWPDGEMSINAFRAYIQLNGGLDASKLNAIVMNFDDGSLPIVELMDGMTDFSILSEFGEQEVDARLVGRELSAVQQADGTWQSRAYTLCLPFYAELFGTGCDFTIYSKAEVTENNELLFTEEMLPFLYPGNAYLIVVNEGTLRLQEEGVTIIAEADEADDDMNSVLLNNGNGQIAGYWLGSLKEIGHDEAVSRKAFTLASDGSFQRITDENPTWKWPAFRATFCATDLMTADKLTTKYQLDANGVEDEEVDRSLPAPASYQGDNDGEATAIAPVIHTINRDGTERWFDLNGRQLSGKPAKKGVYINKGNKVVIK